MTETLKECHQCMKQVYFTVLVCGGVSTGWYSQYSVVFALSVYNGSQGDELFLDSPIISYIVSYGIGNPYFD